MGQPQFDLSEPAEQAETGETATETAGTAESGTASSTPQKQKEKRKKPRAWIIEDEFDELKQEFERTALPELDQVQQRTPRGMLRKVEATYGERIKQAYGERTPTYIILPILSRVFRHIPDKNLLDFCQRMRREVLEEKRAASRKKVKEKSKKPVKPEQPQAQAEGSQPPDKDRAA